MMNFNDFKNAIKNKIGGYLTEDYADADMSLSEVGNTRERNTIPI